MITTPPHANRTIKSLIEPLDTRIDWTGLPRLATWLIEQAITLQQIPAPTFEEALRARWMADQFAALGIQEIEIDALHNVYGVRRGQRSDLPAVMVSAHTDTIFAAQTDLTVRREPGIVHGPGIGDNSLGAAALLGLIRGMDDTGITCARDVWVVATTREEGLGDLGGMRAAYDRLSGRIDRVINIEGLAFGHVYHAGIAVRRLHITAHAQGGHSWLHFGRPSATHTILQLGAKITALHPPTQPRTTYNIGMIEGGEAINAIATQAGLWLDMRSEDRTGLETLERAVRQCITTLLDVRWQVEVVGDRPAGSIPVQHDMVQAALAALTLVGVRGTLETGSTDANIPLSVGCPAVTVGITRGGNAHRLDEYIETGDIEAGLRQLIVLTLAAAS